MASPLTGLDRARQALARGASLKNAANLIGVTPADLDLMLWRTLGSKTPPLHP